ncbi:MAG: C39 family peptidase [Nocardioides sp.]
MLRSLLAGALAATLAVPVLPGAPASAAPTPRRIVYTSWTSNADFGAGTLQGVALSHGRLVMDAPVAARRYAGRRYDVARWVSPWRTPRFGLTELIASWNARTPGNSWIEVQVRGRSGGGRTSSWDVLGRWGTGEKFIHRTSVPAQGDDLAGVNVDTWQTRTDMAGWQLRVLLMRGRGAPSPVVEGVGAVVSRLPHVSGVATSDPGTGPRIVLPVPRYSQMAHRGHYPRWGGGGEAWCSPTSTSMVLGRYDALPAAGAYGWIPKGHVDPWVDYAARKTYDSAYAGTGNWPFNTAYAATLADDAFVTRLRNLREARYFIEAGIPLVASISFGPGELSGAPITSTNGHLLVIVGFTASGDVVVNDPAASTRAGVRRTYDRAQFEDAWIPSSGGLVYVIRDRAHPLPDPARHSNW